MLDFGCCELGASCDYHIIIFFFIFKTEIPKKLYEELIKIRDEVDELKKKHVRDTDALNDEIDELIGYTRLNRGNSRPYILL